MSSNTTITPEAALTPIDSDRMRQAAELLLTARRTRESIADLPVALRPHTLNEAYAIQDILAEALGAIGGWKVGAATAGATPIFAPMPLLGGFVPTSGTLAGSMSRYRGVEAEIAFLLGSDLPVRELPYSREEVAAAIASCHPAIEILETGLTDPDPVEAFTRIADLQMNGGFAYGAAYAGWQTVDFGKETASMSIDGVVRIEAGAPDGFDPIGLLAWLANQGQQRFGNLRTGGLRAGDWITTGSWTGKACASGESEAIARFSSFGECRIEFE